MAFVSKLVVFEELERGDLVAFAVEGAEAMRRSVFLLRPAGREPLPAEQVFVETLGACCKAAGVAGCVVESCPPGNPPIADPI